MSGPGSVLAVHAVDSPGGAEVSILRLFGELAERGWTLGQSTPSGEGPMVRPGVEHDRLDVGGLGAREGARAVASFPRARRLGARWDIVYLNSTVCGRLLPALRGARTVLHVHDIVDRVPRHWANADLVLADSQAVADRLGELSAQVVYCPVDLDPPPAPRPWPDDGRPVVGYVGRIEPRKGALDLIAAAPEIRERLPGARIVLVGGDPYDSAPDYLAAVRASTEVDHLDWVENAPGLMRHLDVLVSPSHQEPFGTVLSEAMAVGTRVVATRVGGLAEVVEEGVTGLLVEPERPEALAEAVARVHADRTAMGAAGRAAARRFGACAYADRVEPLLRGLLP
ncbi:MAG: glycosyltransferase family 4 protein [Solirubrobacterales bacterium]|nr:glycosyltransferase family 4 protein [Solirubrobacterales bacterium]